MADLPRLYHPELRPFEQVDQVALAISCEPPRPPRAEVRHVGVLFREREGAREVRLLHLAWHCKARNDEPPDEFSWLELPMPSTKKRVFAGLCRLLAQKYTGPGARPLAYAFRYTGGRFDPATRDFLSEGGHGLTCATFVLAVFASHGVQLLRAAEWLPRIDDLPRLQELLGMLRAQLGHESEHVKAVEGELGCVRFRPEEVAAAGAVEALPLGFEDAKRLGERIVASMLARAAP